MASCSNSAWTLARPASASTWPVPRSHHRRLVSVDFFTVPTLRFQILNVFLVLAHDRRRILHFGVTAHPTAEWTAQQLRNTFPWDTTPRCLLRDRDRIFGHDFTIQVEEMGIREVLSAPRSPWPRGLRGAFDRNDSARVFGPRHCLQRSFPVPACEVVRGVLSRIQNTPFAR